jgi:DNA-binding NarL/FixJ family response regulator
MATHDYAGSARFAPEPVSAPPTSWKEDVEPADAWRALMRGGWTVAEHGVCADTIVVRLASRQSGRGTLSTAELRVGMARASGASIKAIAYDTGWTYGAVTECVAHVMRKLRLRSQAELVVFFHEASRRLSATRVRYGGGDYLVLTYPTPRWSLPPCLSSTEQRIVLDLIAGSSQHAIARGRGTSARTVANQVASIYRKLNIHSRIELFVALWNGEFTFSSAPLSPP